MKTDSKEGMKQKIFLSSEIILRYLIYDDDKTDTLIMCNSSEIDLVTTDFNLYEAVGSVKNYDTFRFHKFAKLFEAVEIQSYKQTKGEEKPILTHERVEELRRLALKQG